MTPATGHEPGTDGHGQHHIDGNAVPSVTQCLPKPDLALPAARHTARHTIQHLHLIIEQLLQNGMARRQLIDELAQQHRNDWNLKADLGTDTHHWCLERILPEPNPDNRTKLVTDAPQHIRPRCNLWTEWVNTNNPEPLLTETVVYNRTHRYAGTPDLICRLHNQTWLLDIKTGKRIPEHAALQLAGYKHAEFHLDPHHDELALPAVQRCGIIHLTATTLELHEIPVGLPEWHAFQAAAALTNWTRRQDLVQ